MFVRFVIGKYGEKFTIDSESTIEIENILFQSTHFWTVINEKTDRGQFRAVQTPNRKQFYRFKHR